MQFIERLLKKQSHLRKEAEGTVKRQQSDPGRQTLSKQRE